jgi:hypothetical protein
MFSIASRLRSILSQGKRVADPLRIGSVRAFLREPRGLGKLADLSSFVPSASGSPFSNH